MLDRSFFYARMLEYIPGTSSSHIYVSGTRYVRRYSNSSDQQSKKSYICTRYACSLGDSRDRKNPSGRVERITPAPPTQVLTGVQEGVMFSPQYLSAPLGTKCQLGYTCRSVRCVASIGERCSAAPRQGNLNNLIVTLKRTLKLLPAPLIVTLFHPADLIHQHLHTRLATPRCLGLVP